MLNSCLDIIEIRRKQTSIDQDLGLLHAIDERLAAYGWLTTTGVKFLIIVDQFGRESVSAGKPAGPAVSGLRDSDLKPVRDTLRSSNIYARDALGLSLQSRLSGHCRARTSSFFKTRSTPRTNTLRFPRRRQPPRPLVSPFQTPSSSPTCNALVRRGPRELPCSCLQRNDALKSPIHSSVKVSADGYDKSLDPFLHHI